MHRFFNDKELRSGAEIEFDSVQSHHLSKVLRLETNEAISIVDGKGSLANATLIEVHPKHSRARIRSVDRSHHRSRISLCFGIPKGQALDFIVRRVTELGVLEFQPLQTRFSSNAKGWNAER